MSFPCVTAETLFEHKETRKMKASYQSVGADLKLDGRFFVKTSLAELVALVNENCTKFLTSLNCQARQARCLYD